MWENTNADAEKTVTRYRMASNAPVVVDIPSFT
jgi:hypothetical protein